MRTIAQKPFPVALPFIASLFVLAAAGYAHGQTSSTVEDRYYLLLDQAEGHYLSRDMAGVADALESISQLRVLEVPTYERRFFEAAIMVREGNRERAAEVLSAFRDMLRIDSGVARCSTTRGLIEINGDERASPGAYQEMCAEAFLSYYEGPTEATLRRVARYWSFADELRVRLEANRQ